MNLLRSRIIPFMVHVGLWGRWRGHPLVAKAAFRTVLQLDPGHGLARRELRKLAPRREGALERVRYVILGTTGTCNASCIHCPTGKEETAHNPRTPMPMDIFRKIIDGIFEHDLPVAGQVAFGLFGDGLVDPLVVERARYLRERLPDVSLSVNTNGAAFNRARHSVLRELASSISLHCESLTPEVYNDLMRPLRAERVFPKFEEVLETFPGMVHVSVPISRKNLGEAAAIREWFLSRGAIRVEFDPLISRCADDRRLFNSLALNPQQLRCGGEIADDLIVDCDGTVLACCQDFQRLEPIGNLATEGFEQTLTNVARNTLRKQMEQQRHGERTTCSRCFADLRTPNFPFDTAA
jgi:radical SAM protein with 4Fe4S-binding SPASM domain